MRHYYFVNLHCFWWFELDNNTWYFYVLEQCRPIKFWKKSLPLIIKNAALKQQMKFLLNTWHTLHLISLCSTFSYLPLSLGNLWFEILNLVDDILHDTGIFNKYISIFRFFVKHPIIITLNIINMIKKNWWLQILIFSVYSFLDDVFKLIYIRYTLCNPMIIQVTIA